MVGQLTPHWERCQGVAGFGTTPSIGHNANTATVDPIDCSTVAETIPSCDRWTPRNRVEDLIVDNTTGSDHREDEGNQEAEPENWITDCSGARQNP